MENAVEDSMASAEKIAVPASNATQNGGTNVVSLGPRDILQGRLEIQGDLKVAGNVEGDLKASGDVTLDSGVTIQAGIEGAHVNVRGQGTGNVTARKRLTLGSSGSGELVSSAEPGADTEGEARASLVAPMTFQMTTTRAATTMSSATTIHVSGERIRLRMTPG